MSAGINVMPIYGENKVIQFGLDEIHAFADDQELRILLEKSFSMEMFLIILQRKNVAGIENLYDEIKSPKPQRASFYRYINRLIGLRIVVVEEDLDKKSRKILKLDPRMTAKIKKCYPCISEYVS